MLPAAADHPPAWLHPPDRALRHFRHHRRVRHWLTGPRAPHRVIQTIVLLLGGWQTTALAGRAPCSLSPEPVRKRKHASALQNGATPTQAPDAPPGGGTCGGAPLPGHRLTAGSARTARWCRRTRRAEVPCGG